MHSIKQWNFPDPAPNIPICEIPRIADRAIALMVRNRNKPLLNTDFLRIYGAVEMVAGMEYHHDNFVRLSRQWAGGQQGDYFRDEAVAYLNRMGQFEAFARSDFVKQLILHPNIPTISRLMVFRHKYAAHRSIDAPRIGDTAELKLSHMCSLSRVFGSLFTPRAGAPAIEWNDPPATLEEATKRIWSTNHLTFQIFDLEAGRHIDFCLEIDHLEVVKEAADIIEALILHD